MVIITLTTGETKAVNNAISNLILKLGTESNADNCRAISALEALQQEIENWSSDLNDSFSIRKLKEANEAVRKIKTQSVLWDEVLDKLKSWSQSNIKKSGTGSAWSWIQDWYTLTAKKS